MQKFWNFMQGEGENRVLLLEGEIASESWWGDEITPKMFKDELNSGSGDVVVVINSPGGDIFAAATIYDALRGYAGKVTVRISALAASAASVVAMAGDEILISPTAQIVIHNPQTVAMGESSEMKKAARALDSIKEGIINAYEQKTKLSRAVLSHMMDKETPMDANEAIRLGFADGLLYAVSNSLLAKMREGVQNAEKQTAQPPQPTGVPAEQLERRLHLLQY